MGLKTFNDFAADFGKNELFHFSNSTAKFGVGGDDIFAAGVIERGCTTAASLLILWMQEHGKAKQDGV